MLTGMKGPDLVFLSLCQACCSLRELSLFPVFPLAALSLFPSSICNSLHMLFPFTVLPAVLTVGLIQKVWYFGIIAELYTCCASVVDVYLEEDSTSAFVQVICSEGNTV